MKALVLAAAFGVAALVRPPPEQMNARRSATAPEPAYLLLDAVTGRQLAARWDDPSRPLPMGSLIKPFTALAYAEAHRFAYPTLVCRGRADGCWLPAGHGRVSIVAALAGSCNAYFPQLSRSTTPEMLVATLRWFGMAASAAEVTPASMVGLGEGLKLTPAAIAHGYLELVARAEQPGVSPIADGLIASARGRLDGLLGRDLLHFDFA